MDSGDFQQSSQQNMCDSPNTPRSFHSTGQTPISQSNAYFDLDQFQTRTFLPNLQSQRTFPNNPMNAQFSSQGFSYQGLMNAPNVVYLAPTSQPSKVSQKRQKTSQTSDTTPTTGSRRFTLAEDIALTKARLRVSSDPDIGTGQKSETLWNRILQEWKANMGTFDATRDSNSLECRWGRLQAAINKFHGFYARALRQKKSGTTLEDVKREALKLYQESNKDQPFKHERCWEICKKDAKWSTDHLTMQDASKKKSVVDSSKENPPTSKETQTDPTHVPGSSSARENDSTDPKTGEAENKNDDGATRPDVGRKAAKDQKRRVAAEKVVADALGGLQSSVERQYELNRVDIELKKEREKKDYELREKIFNAEIELKERNQRMKEKAQRRKEQKDILKTPLSKLTPIVREKFEKMQVLILEEWEKDGFLGELSGNNDINI